MAVAISLGETFTLASPLIFSAHVHLVSREQMGPSQFDVLKYVDQGKVFGKVHTALAHGKCLGVSALLMVPPFLMD